MNIGIFYFDIMLVSMQTDLKQHTPPAHSRRGWVIAWFGLVLAFNIYIVSPLGIYDLSDIGLVFFLMMIGTPIAISGLVLSIIDKSLVYGTQTIGKIIPEIVFLMALFGNAFVFLTAGTIGV
ncbi:MAG: hypothetical protein VXV89_06900 [Candidatus Thermoplasmatota archaeon]|nr:hypothetical protein [Candidatus Thermoplasmatota archaeon]